MMDHTTSEIVGTKAGKLNTGALLSGASMVVLMLVAGCTSLPSGGPSSRSFNKANWQYNAAETGDEKAKSELPFVLVDVDPRVLEVLRDKADASFFKGAFTDKSPPVDTVLGVGDILRITIFEAGPGGLFVSSNATMSNGNYVTLPDQEIDQMGRISVPYAGKGNDSGFIKAQGRRLAEVQHEIQQRLLNKAIEPQVIVSMVKRTSNMYSVMGEVNAPGRFGLEQGGLRILDALSTAGGPKHNDYNTLITLQRGAKSATARMSTLLTEPDNNIFLQPGDLLAVKKDERYYNILGAAHTNNRIPFEAESATVADALAKAGGLDHEVAEPAAVVVLRREDVSTLESMGVKLDGNDSAQPIPTVYRFNLTEPTGMFLAQKMDLHNNDVVYVSPHPFTDASKILGALRDVLLIRLIND